MRLFRGKKKWFGIALLMLFLGFLTLEPWAWMFGQPMIRVSPETTNIVSPRKDDGSVDYVAALNAKYSAGITPENNAVVLLMQGFGPHVVSDESRADYFRMLGVEPPPADGIYFCTSDQFTMQQHHRGDDSDIDDLSEQFDEAIRRPWSEEEFPKAADWLQKNEPSLKRFVAASERSRYYEPLVGNTIMNAPLPALTEIRSAARALATRSMLRLHNKQNEAALADSLAILRLGHLIETQSTSLIGPLIGTALHQLALENLAALSFYSQMPADRYQQLRLHLAAFNRTFDLASKIDQDERWSLLDVLQASERTGGEIDIFNPRPEAPWKVKLRRGWNQATIDWNEALMEFNQRQDHAVEVCREPDRTTRVARLKQLSDEIKQLDKSQRSQTSIGRSFVGRAGRGRTMGLTFWLLMFPAVDSVDECCWGNLARTSMTEMSLSLAGYRTDHGEFPQTLNELAPKYLDSVPKDLFGGGDFHYQRTAAGYRLYSNGTNEIDDGGIRDNDACDDIVFEFPIPPRKSSAATPPGTITPEPKIPTAE